MVKTGMRQWWCWIVITVVFFGFCCAFNANTPYRSPGILLHQKGPNGLPARVPDVGAPDERQHANYIKHLLDGKGFPVLQVGSSDLYESYQSHQPPLYYLVAAAWCKVTGADPTSSQGFSLRLLNTFIGVSTLIAVGLGAWWGFKSRPLALAAPAILLMPMSVALHSSVTNDPLLFSLCSWCLAFLGLAIAKGWSTKVCLLIALSAGLAFLTKTTAVALIPTIGIAVLLSLSDKDRRPSAVHWVILISVPLLIGGGWWARNISLYGDPFAMSAFNSAFTGSPQASAFIASEGAAGYWSNWVLWWTSRSFIGTFGYSDIFMFESKGMAKSSQICASLILVFSIISVMSLAAVPKLKDDKNARQFALVGAVFALVVCFFFVSFNKQYFQGQARYLYPAVAPIGWLMAAGLCVLMGRHKEWSWAVWSSVLIILDVVALNEIVTGFALRAG